MAWYDYLWCGSIFVYVYSVLLFLILPSNLYLQVKFRVSFVSVGLWVGWEIQQFQGLFRTRDSQCLWEELE